VNIGYLIAALVAAYVDERLLEAILPIIVQALREMAHYLF
jgi:hypothetical protein